jgi:GTP-binding protein
MKSLPIVALIGQTNAGKSSLFNRLTRAHTAIVAREEGTTRDNVVATLYLDQLSDSPQTAPEKRVPLLRLIDTAGLKDPKDDFEASIQDQIADAVASADLIIIVMDSTKYVNHDDKLIAKKALKSTKPVLLALNKSDLKGSLPPREFLSLGIKSPLYLSATTGQGVSELKNAIKRGISGERLSLSRDLPTDTREDGLSREKVLSGEVDESHNSLRIALIGRPNVGKSSLFNSLGEKQQALVANLSGTTRDINRLEVKYHGKPIEILDTAGLRKPGKREVGVEKFSVLRTLAAIEESDICCLLIDATEPHSKLDQTLAGQIVDAGKGIILVVTKSDLLEVSEHVISPVKKSDYPESKNLSERSESFFDLDEKKTFLHSRANDRSENPIGRILNNMEQDFNFLPYAPVIITSAKTGANVTKIFELAREISAGRKSEIKTSELNKILTEAVLRHPPAGLKNTLPKPKYIVQTDVAPPWFVIHGHDLKLLHWSWKRYLERKIREKYPFIGTPINFSFRDDK